MQYDLNGKKLKTYPGINMASKVTGTPEAGIMNVLKGREIFANKFVWAYGILRKMDVAAIRQLSWKSVTSWWAVRVILSIWLRCRFTKGRLV